MRIAYLILAYNNFRHLQRLTDSLSTECTNFYIHIDKRVKVVTPIKGSRIKYIKRRNSYWSTWNCVQPVIDMLKEAYDDGNDYFVLLSGQDYPIASNERIVKELSAGKERFWMTELNGQKPSSWFKHYHFIMERRSKGLKYYLAKKLEKFSRSLLNKEFPFKIYIGSTWFGTTRECAQYILETIEKKKEYVRFFKHSRFPEESFFVTIVGNSPYGKANYMDLTWTEFGDKGCRIIGNRELDICKNSDYLFARKFTDSSDEILAKIDRGLRNSA